MIRGEEAERDEEFCREFCKNFPSNFCKKINVPSIAEKEKSVRSFVEGMSDIKNLTSFPKSLTVKSQLHTRFPIMRKR